MVKFHKDALEVQFCALDAKDDQTLLMRSLLAAVRWYGCADGFDGEPAIPHMTHLTDLMDALLCASLDTKKEIITFRIPAGNPAALRAGLSETLLSAFTWLADVEDLRPEDKGSISLIGRLVV